MISPLSFPNKNINLSQPTTLSKSSNEPINQNIFDYDGIKTLSDSKKSLLDYLKIRNPLADALVCFGTATTLVLSMIEGGELLESALIAKYLGVIFEAFTVLFTVADYIKVVPADINDLFAEFQNLANHPTLKNWGNIFAKALPLFFLSKWLFGEKFLLRFRKNVLGNPFKSWKTDKSSNLNKIFVAGTVPLVALFHVIFAHLNTAARWAESQTGNLKSTAEATASWFIRVALIDTVKNFIFKGKDSLLANQFKYFLLQLFSGPFKFLKR